MTDFGGSAGTTGGVLFAGPKGNPPAALAGASAATVDGAAPPDVPSVKEEADAAVVVGAVAGAALV